MDVNHCFPTTIFSFTNPEIVQEITDKLKLEPNGVSPNYPSLNQTIDQDLHKSTEWKFLCNWIDTCLKEIQDYEIHDTNFGRIKITKMWANISLGQSGGGHSVHRHPNSVFSGIFYVTDGAPTKFLDPVYARSLSSIEIPILNNFDRLTINPKPGLMIIFPSYLQHCTDAHYGDDVRITFSFNTLPESFGNGFSE